MKFLWLYKTQSVLWSEVRLDTAIVFWWNIAVAWTKQFLLFLYFFTYKFCVCMCLWNGFVGMRFYSNLFTKCCDERPSWIWDISSRGRLKRLQMTNAFMFKLSHIFSIWAFVLQIWMMVIKNLSNYFDIERTCIAIDNLRPIVSDYLAERKQREVGEGHARWIFVSIIVFIFDCHM